MTLVRLLILTLALCLIGCRKSPDTYSAACSIPLSHWKTEKDGVGHLLPVVPVYVGTDGTVLMNKEAIPDSQLSTYMDQAIRMNPVPLYILEVSPSAACARVRKVRAIMDASPMCKGPYSHCSEGWNWRQWPVTGGP